MKRGFKFLLFAAALALLWGCYPQGPEYAEEMDVVLTNHNDKYDFVSKATYALPDRIVKITGNLEDGEDPEFIPDIYADQILAMIRENMDALGWDEVDVAAHLSADADEFVGVFGLVVDSSEQEVLDGDRGLRGQPGAREQGPQLLELLAHHGRERAERELARRPVRQRDRRS